MSVAAVRVTVGVTAVEVASAADDFDGASFVLRNRGTVSVYLGAANVTSAAGFELEAGESIAVDLERNEQLFAISDSAGQVVHTLRTGT